LRAREALWAPTFADLAALLLGLFALLVALHEPDLERFAALRAAHDGGTGASAPRDERAGQNARVRLRERLATWSRAHGARIAVLRDENAATSGVWIELGASALRFAPGTAEPSEALRAALAELPAAIGAELGRAEVGGHLSADESARETHGAEAELALARAEVGLELLRAGGIAAQVLSRASYAAAFPPADADPRTPEGRSAARRLTLRLEERAP
jgi:flagellar motor protein MotB